MIIWIASYPKSGNTWIRSLLCSYLYSQDGSFNFNLLKKIPQFPNTSYFKFFLNEMHDIKKVSNYWIAAQDRINLLNNGITFFKTHSALCTLENNSFTNGSNTKAAIYVVRDPRNLITSLSHHYSLEIEGAYNFLINKQQMLTKNEHGSRDFGIATILGSWSQHYISWKSIKFAPILIVKYEDLIKDTKGSFTTIINFLSKFMDIKLDEEKISHAVDSCSFDKLVDLENKEGFNEAVASKKNEKKLKFFYLGKKNNWKNLLDKELENKTRSEFMNEMKELNYI